MLEVAGGMMSLIRELRVKTKLPLMQVGDPISSSRPVSRTSEYLRSVWMILDPDQPYDCIVRRSDMCHLDEDIDLNDLLVISGACKLLPSL